MEKEFRLGRSLLPRPDDDRRVSAEAAEAALVADISTAHGRVISSRLRAVSTAIRTALPKLLKAEICGIEVENRLLHLGHINVRGLYLVDPSAEDIDLPLHRIVVEFAGFIRTTSSPLSERGRAVLCKTWGVSRQEVSDE